MNTRGAACEALACAHLQTAGLSLLARNFRTRFGELDLVMRDGDIVVFVEVRYRAGHRYGNGADSVTGVKQARLTAAAQQFLQAHPRLAALPCRFDVVAMTGADAQPIIDWRRSAFDSA